ncbi:purine nucleoside permease [Sphingomonas sp.]|uniref:purine-nucleoside phosphorylase n=1 Tax=Sphingomonas sp. TaxID=28214 RepID=UPI0025DEF13E|nr:purine nucleoside permease [Sphingomonas sp.]
MFLTALAALCAPALACAQAPSSAAVAPAARPIEIRMVIVTAFEIGEDTGDKPAEYQAWAAVMPEVLPFPAGFRHLRYDPKKQALLIMTGIGTNRAAASIMALGLDPRFDLTHAYWMIAAIAGANPHTATVGSAAWIGDLVDTDYGYGVDPREAPKGWTTGMFPRDRTAPYQGKAGDTQYNLFPLNKGLRDWAYALTKDMKLPDTPALQQIRAGYADSPAAMKPPSVIRGDEATGQTFWHGKLMNDHAERWVAYWTGRPDSFVMTGMEDTGVANALNGLGRLGKADPSRLMVLRTGSNFTTQPAGGDAASSLIGELKGLSAFQASLDAAFGVGSKVEDEITGNWSRYRDTVPGAAQEIVTK